MELALEVAVFIKHSAKFGGDNEEHLAFVAHGQMASIVRIGFSNTSVRLKNEIAIGLIYANVLAKRDEQALSARADGDS